MISVGQVYRAAGPINVRSVLSTLILGTVTAFLSAAVVWGWEISPIPTLVIITPILQGLGIGLVLAFMIGRLQMRNPKLMGTIGFACGLASVLLVHYGHHLRFLDTVGEMYRSKVAANKDLSPEQKQVLLAKLDHGAAEIADPFLVAKTGHQGLIGSLLWRSEMGVQIKNTTLTGWGVWLLWGAEAFMVAAFAAGLATSRAGEPYCEECGAWCVKSPGKLILPGTAAGALASAIQSDDTAGVIGLRDQPIDLAGGSPAGTNLHSCSGCDATFADVWQRIDKVVNKKKGKVESSVKTLVTRVRVSPEMAYLLRHEPEPPAEMETEIAEV